MPETLLDAKAVTQKTTLHISTVYKMLAKNRFPQPVRLGPQIVRWRESEIDQWIESLPRVGAETTGEQA
jgi:prophage regulatory protein